MSKAFNLLSEAINDVKNNPKQPINSKMLFSQDEVKHREYELQEKAIRDYNATMLYNRKEAKREGKQEGKQEEKYENAVRGLKNNISLDAISTITGLSIEQLKEIQKTLL